MRRNCCENIEKDYEFKGGMVLVFLCWFAYFTSYIGRLNYSSAMVLMIQESILTKSQSGFISMVYFLAYGIGQMCNGFLGDKVYPSKMIFLGLFFASLANFFMGLCHNFSLMTIIWGINGYAQSMIWPPIIRIFAEMLEEKQKIRFCINIVSSQVVGTLGSYLIAAGVIWLLGWKAVFEVAGFCLLVMSIVWLWGFHKGERYSENHSYVSDLDKPVIYDNEQKEKSEIFTPFHNFRYDNSYFSCFYSWNVKRWSYHMDSYIYCREIPYISVIFNFSNDDSSDF